VVVPVIVAIGALIVRLPRHDTPDTHGEAHLVNEA